MRCGSRSGKLAQRAGGKNNGTRAPGWHFDSTKGYPGEGPKAAAGKQAPRGMEVLSVNVTRVSSLWKFLDRCQPTAHVILVQETHVKDQNEDGAENPGNKVRQKAMQKGYRALLTGAYDTGRGGNRGGLVTLWRPDYEVIETAQVWDGHANGILVKVAKVGCIAIFNVYGCPDGNQELNRRMIGKVAQQAAAWGKPFLVGGDFNMLPGEVQGILKEQAIPAQVNAPSGATCVTTKACRTIDMFVVSHRLSAIGTSPAKTKHSGGVKTHTPVGTVVKTRQAKAQVTIHKRPKGCKDDPTMRPWATFDYTVAAKKIEELCEDLGLAGAGPRMTKYPAEEWVKKLEAAYEAWHEEMAEELKHIYAQEEGPQKRLTFHRCSLGDLCGGSLKAKRGTPSVALGYMKDRVRELLAHKEEEDSGRQQLDGDMLRRWVRHDKIKDIKHHLHENPHEDKVESFRSAIDKWTEQGAENCSHDELDDLHKALREAHDEQVKVEHKLQATEWQVYVEEALTTKVAAGFRLAHIAELEDTPKVLGKEGFSTGLRNILDEETRKWKELWEVGTGENSFEDELLRQEVKMMPPLSAEEIRAAAMSFKKFTSNIEGCSPRQVGQLSTSCLEVLAKIFYSCECLGLYPRVLEQKLVKLLVKKDGGTRPIMLFRTLYRIHAKARGEIARRWEAREAAGPSFNNSPQRRIGDVVYRQAVRNAIAEAEGRHIVEVCWDFKKAFEHVQRPLLWQKAKQQGYPLALLRMSLRSYGWERRILTEHNVVSGPLKARRGIAAGSAFAIYELKVYCMEFTKITQRIPGATLSLHVDDTIVRVEGADREGVTEMLAKVVERAQEELKVIKMPLATDKEAVLATDEGLRKEAIRVLGSTKQKDNAGHVVKLGVDYNISKTRGPLFCRKRLRFTVFRKKASKLKKILQKRAYGRIMQAGLITGVMYGAEISDYTTREMEVIKKEALRSERLHVAGVPNAVKWLLLGAKKDPEARIRMAPILAYHREVWHLSLGKEGWPPPEDGLTAKEAVKFWALVEKEVRGISTGESEAMDGKGTSAAVVALAKGLVHFGVHLPTPVDLEGELRYGLDVTSGGRIKQALLEAADEQYAAQVAEWVIRHGVATEQEKEDIVSNGLLWRPLRQKANALTAGNRRILAAMVAGQLRFGSEVRGYNGRQEDGTLAEPPVCPICQQGKDGYLHRVMECPFAVKLRAQEATDKGLKEISGLTTLNRRGLWARERKWVPIDSEAPKFSINGIIQKVPEGTAFFKAEDGALFLDGSGFHGGTEVAVAAGAVVQRTPAGAWKEATMGVYDLGSQTAATGEILAARMAVEYSDNGQHTFVVDCAAVISGWNRRFIRPCYQGPTAGLWRQIAAIERGKERPPPHFEKTKAHRTQAVAEAEGDLENFTGNEEADRAAKAAAEAHGPPPSYARPATARWQQAKRTIGLLTKTIIEGFKVGGPKQGNMERKAKGRASKPTVPHTPVWESRLAKFRCVACGLAGANLHAVQRCKGRSGAALAVLNTASRAGHVLWEGRLTGGQRHGQQALFCIKCGSTATVRAVNLKEACPLEPKGASQKRLLAKLAKGDYAYEKGTAVVGLAPSASAIATSRHMWEQAKGYHRLGSSEAVAEGKDRASSLSSPGRMKQGALEGDGRAVSCWEDLEEDVCVSAACFEEGFSLEEMEAFFGPLDH